MPLLQGESRPADVRSAGGEVLRRGVQTLQTGEAFFPRTAKVELARRARNQSRNVFKPTPTAHNGPTCRGQGARALNRSVFPRALSLEVLNRNVKPALTRGEGPPRRVRLRLRACARSLSCLSMCLRDKSAELEGPA